MKALWAQEYVRRTAALVLLCTAMTLAWLGTGQVYINHLTRLNQDIADSLNTIQRFTQLAAQREQLDATLKTLSHNAQSGSLFNGTDGNLVAADLQGKIKSIVGLHQGTIRSMGVMPGVDETPYTRVSIKADIEATMTSLQAILLSLATASPNIFVDGLHIRRTTDASGTKNDGVLRINMTVHGYFMKGGAL